MGKDVLSPPAHSAFGNMQEMVDFIEEIAENTGLPVGIKAAIGKLDEWKELAQIMEKPTGDPTLLPLMVVKEVQVLHLQVLQIM